MKSNSNGGRRASCRLGVHGISIVLLFDIQQQSDNNVPHIDPDKFSALKKKYKKQEKQLRKWEIYAIQRVGPKRQKVPKELSIGKSNQQYADVCVMVKDPKTGKGKMICALLDSGCIKSIILKKSTSPQVRTRLNEKDYCTYKRIVVISHLVLLRW